MKQPHLKYKFSLGEKINLKVLKNPISKSYVCPACSDYLMKMTCRLYKPGIIHGQVVQNGIDFSTFSSPQKRLVKEKYIFASGRLIYAKGFDLLISAFAKLPEDLIVRYTLVIAGSGPAK